MIQKYIMYVIYTTMHIFLDKYYLLRVNLFEKPSLVVFNIVLGVNSENRWACIQKLKLVRCCNIIL